MQKRNKQYKRRADTGLKVCFATKTTAPREEMLRFVISPERTVVFDVAEKLPGAGMWLKADYAVLHQAVTKKLFYKAAGGTVRIPEDLEQTVETALKERCLSLLGFARKAGCLVFGYEGVKKAIGTGETVLAFEATDAAENGKNKLFRPTDEIRIFEFLTREELGRITGQETQVHVAVLRSSGARELLKIATKLSLYLNEGKDR